MEECAHPIYGLSRNSAFLAPSESFIISPKWAIIDMILPHQIRPTGELTVRVIFLEDIPNQGNAGDLKNVADGYARNYLIPKRLATVATAEDMKRIERIKRAGDQRRVRETEQLNDLAGLLEGTNVTVTARVTPAGHFYGTIGPAQIAQELGEVTGREIDRRLVETVEPIRDPGEYDVVLRLAPGIEATIIVTAEAQE